MVRETVIEGREREMNKKMKTFLAKVKNRYFDVWCIIK